MTSAWLSKMHNRIQAIGSGTVMVGMALVALIVLLALGNATSWDATWRAVGVTPLQPHFFDMHAVTDHAACAAKGFNAYESNSCSEIRFNYPPIWLQLGKLGINGSHSEWLSIFAAFVAFLVIAILLKGRSALDGVISSAVFLSPSVMMGVERGNIDLLILALVGLAALGYNEAGIRRAFGAALIALAAVILKLYPFFCIAVLARFNRRSLLFAIVLVTGSLIYLYSILDYLPIIRANTPTSFKLSYGYKVIFLGLDHLRLEAHREILNLPDTWLPIVLLSAVIFLAVAVAILASARCETFCVISDSTSGAAFLFGSGIFCGTYLLGSNFIYRLMFLSLCIPQLQEWAGSRTGNSKHTVVTAYFFQTLILLVLWWNGNSNGHTTFLATPQMLNWGLFFGLVIILALNCIRSIPGAPAVKWKRPSSVAYPGAPATNDPDTAARF